MWINLATMFRGEITQFVSRTLTTVNSPNTFECRSVRMLQVYNSLYVFSRCVVGGATYNAREFSVAANVRTHLSSRCCETFVCRFYYFRLIHTTAEAFGRIGNDIFLFFANSFHLLISALRESNIMLAGWRWMRVKEMKFLFMSSILAIVFISFRFRR